MGVIRSFFGLVLIVVFAGFGYWMYATYNSGGDDAVWAGINELMPQALRQWSCSEIEQRAGREPAPQSCAEFWNVPGPEEAAAPGTESGADIAVPAEELSEEPAPASATAAE